MGISTEIVDLGHFVVIPLYSWYDYTFAPLNDRLLNTWSDFALCQWSMNNQELSDHFHRMNESVVNSYVKLKFTVSVSHFMPSIELIPSYVPSHLNYLWPVLGSNVLGKQVRKLKPDIHVYGHSHVNVVKIIDDIVYVNNAFGYPSENTKSTLIQLNLTEIEKINK